MADDTLEEIVERLKKLTGNDKLTGDPFADEQLMWMEDAFGRPELLIPPEKISPWLCWRGKTTLLVAPPFGRKSSIASCDAMEAGKMGQTVLYITIDEPVADLVLRFKAYDEPTVIQKRIAILEPNAELNWDAITLFIEEVKPDIIYFDSWDTLIGELENNLPDGHQLSKNRKLIQRFVNMSRKYNCAVCIFIHTPRNDPTRYAGSGQIGAAVDVEATIHMEKSHISRIEYKSRVILPPSVRLEWMENDGGRLREIGAKQTPNDWLLSKMRDEALHSPTALQEAGEVAGFKKKDINGARSSLQSSGYIEELRDKKNHRYINYKITDLGTERLNVVADDAMSRLKNPVVSHLP